MLQNLRTKLFNAIFLDSDKALLFMRWIRQHIKSIEEGKLETQ